YHTRGAVPFLFRLGGGALLGEERDARAASFPAGAASGTETPAARYAYIAPELRVGWRVAEHVELTAGAAVLVLVALTQPRWQDEDVIVVARDFVSFGDQRLAGSIVVLVTPGLGLRYEL